MKTLNCSRLRRGISLARTQQTGILLFASIAMMILPCKCLLEASSRHFFFEINPLARCRCFTNQRLEEKTVNIFSPAPVRAPSFKFRKWAPEFSYFQDSNQNVDGDLAAGGGITNPTVLHFRTIGQQIRDGYVRRNTSATAVPRWSKPLNWNTQYWLIDSKWNSASSSTIW